MKVVTSAARNTMIWCYWGAWQTAW